ncbi:uroporphyrinogen-III synthase [Wolbachia endosymbiont of Cruorifilaria tuberocauda]|uniref:uroporphyrinogen-III synthase n=1 Tax=Wolbachia endosymbiont of Cruorifilaria tuberocauda TaxID=1812111 RepID=UPI001588419A|nr:uroporphyrinogen-III synthase [Wolbachia endosymbiont of Cruorifilaria tuberocauda]QKX01675.1 uroporphyrinogen-III synthase [Wolbachia endosymbiont of Cruorifilaria tuberocauda]
MKSILLTRPLSDSLNTRNTLRKYGYKVYIEPVFTIKYLQPDISTYEFDVVISTSKNSVKAFTQICKVDDIQIVAVGNSTMQTAKDLGFSNIISADSNVDGLVSFIKNHYSITVKFLYIRGQEVSCDLKKRLSEEGFYVREVILYKTIIKKSLTNRCKNLLSGNKVNSIVFFSSQTARVFCSLVLKSGLSYTMASIIAYTMSKNIADSLKLVKWKKIMTSKLPTMESLINIINKDH